MVFQLVGKLSQRVVLLQVAGILRQGNAAQEVFLAGHDAVDKDYLLGGGEHLLDAWVFNNDGFRHFLGGFLPALGIGGGGPR